MTYSGKESDARTDRMVTRCAAAGVLWVPVSDGQLVWQSEALGSDDWRVVIPSSRRAIRDSLQEVVCSLFENDPNAIHEFEPGIWIGLSEVKDRREYSRGIAVMITSESVDMDWFQSACTECGMDHDDIRRQVEHESRIVPATGIPGMMGVLRQMHESECVVDHGHEVAESVDQRLSESYEEIHLLHSLISGLVVGTEPDPFLRSAAEELGAVGGFSWTAVLVDETTEAFAPDHVVVGEEYPTRAELRRMVRRWEFENGQSAVARDADAHGEIVACPIHIEQRKLGVLLAGGRTSGPASNVELKLVSAAAGHIGIFLANASLYADLDAMFLGTLQALVAAIDAKDPYTRGHSQRVALLSRDLAAALGMPEEFVKRIHLAGLVHDVGKIGVPESVLCKPGKLNDEEAGRIRQHPQIGYRILKDIPQIRELLPAVLCHHEAWDGSGYPAGISGEEIPLIARIVSVADSFDAMSSSRTYRSALPREKVFAELERCAGTQFDPALVPTFLGLDLRAYDRHLLRDSIIEGQDSSNGMGLEAA